MTSRPGCVLRGFSVAGAIAVAFVAIGAMRSEIASAQGQGREAEGEPIRLEYRAGPGCPDESSFFRRIRARTARVRLARDAESARTFKVELKAGSPPTGSVTVMAGSRSEGTRRLDADTCNDVADALALMVALALDPHAGRAPEEPARGSPGLAGASGQASTPLPDATLDASAPDSSDSSMLDSSASDSSVVDAAPDSPGPDSSAPDAEASLEPTPPPPPPPPSDEETARTALASRRPPPHYFVGVDLALATDVTPHLLFAGAPYVGYRTTRPILFGLGLSIRASFLRAGTGTIPATGGAADYLWTVGRLDGCAMLWPARPLRIGGCLRAEAGVLDVQGEQIIPAQTQHSAWVAGGLLARVDWSLFGPVFLDASGGPSLRITAHPFVFLPDTLVYEVPVVGFSAEAGVGVHFL